MSNKTLAPSLFLLIHIYLSIGGCGTHTQYLQNVGDIEFNPQVDNSNAQSDTKYQYYNFHKGINYENEKVAIIETFTNEYNTNCTTKESGYITIRFIVRKNAQTDCFRISEMDMNYNKKKFDKSISSQIFQITRKLEGWIPGKLNNHVLDYYQYLTFKIEDGFITEILP